MQNFSKVDFGKFKSAMFDYDGTLTARGVWTIDDALFQRIGELLATGFPMAICTGRQLSSVEKRFGPTFDRLREKFGDEAAGNMYLIAENGSVGYEYDFGGGDDGGPGSGEPDSEGPGSGEPDSGGPGSGEGDGGPSGSGSGWRMFHQAKWPKEVPKADFENKLSELLEGKVEILTHLVPIVLAPLGRENMEIDMVYEKSAEVFKILYDFMNKYEATGGGNALDYLHVGDSGLGCLICPVDGDKDTAIRVFYEFLKNEKGVKFDGDCDKAGTESRPGERASPGIGIGSEAGPKAGQCREIMVIGDNPQTGGNDHYFLNGRYGFSFTVGEDPDDGAEWPLRVFDEDEKRLMNNEGTLYLLNKIPL